MDGSALCTLLTGILVLLVWFYLVVSGGIGGIKAMMYKGDEAPRPDAWILFALAYCGVFLGVIPVVVAAVLRGRVWPRVNFDDDTVGTILLDDTTGRLITVQLFLALLVLMLVFVVVLIMVSSSL